MNPIQVVTIACGAGALALLLRSELRGATRARATWKGIASLSFLVAALAGGPKDGTDWLVLAGLVACLAGDMLLVGRGKGWFLGGLAAFLVGHLLYLAAFTRLAPLAALPVSLAALLVAAFAAVLAWLWSGLGAMRLPVAAYALAISLMLAAALAVWLVGAAGPRSWMLGLGAVLFYLSDLFVARHAFRKQGPENALAGLPLYFAGQFLIALTVGAVGR